MKRRTSKKADATKIPQRTDISTIMLSAVLLCGICAGCIAASYLSGDGAGELHEYLLKNILTPNNFSGKDFFFKTAICAYKYPLIVFLSGYTVFGVVIIPVVVFANGFFTSFSAASVVSAFGYKGLGVALSLYGIQALVSIPCTLIIASKAIKASQGFFSFARADKERRLTTQKLDGYLTCFLICFLLLTICAAIESFLIPTLLTWSYGLIS